MSLLLFYLLCARRRLGAHRLQLIANTARGRHEQKRKYGMNKCSQATERHFETKFQRKQKMRAIGFIDCSGMCRKWIAHERTLKN